MSLHLVFTETPEPVRQLLPGFLRVYAGDWCTVRDILLSGSFRLVAKYVGQTATVMEVVNKPWAECSLSTRLIRWCPAGQNDFGYEAVDTLLKAMEDRRDDLIVIVAGYPDKMEGCGPTGLQSRFNKYINFDDYSLRLMAILTGCEKKDISH